MESNTMKDLESLCADIEDIKISLKQLNEKVQNLQTVVFLNGDDGKTPTKMDLPVFLQLLYDRTSFKKRLEVVSTLSQRILTIIQLLVSGITLLGLYDIITKLKGG